MFTDFQDSIFDYLTLNLKKLSKLESENKNEIRDILSEIYILKHKIQDCIFGPLDDVLLYYDNVKSKLKDYFDYNKNFLNNDEYDLLNKLIINLEDINLNNQSLFEPRREELKKMFTDELSVFKKFNTTIISDNPKMQIYYKKNLKEKWGLDIDINTTQSPKKAYKYAIVPSEFSKERISKIINEYRFKNINFFTTPTIKEKINDVIKFNKSRWRKYFMEPSQKIKINKINNEFEYLFNSPEHSLQHSSSLQSLDNKIDLEALLDKPFDRNKLKSTNDTEDQINARVIIFYGNAYGYFTENTDFKNINKLFSFSKKKDNLISEVSFKDLRPDDFLLIRDSSDRDVIESEAKLQFNDPNEYQILKTLSKKWYDILSNSIGENQISTNNLYLKMKLFGYDKSKATFRNIINNLIICPDEPRDLKILIKSLEELTNKDLCSEKEIDKIQKCADRLKSTHRKAGRLMSKKILNALKDKDVDVGREPVRVDYNKDGSISLNQQESDKPEAWIVQILEIDKDIYKVSQSELNNLLY